MIIMMSQNDLRSQDEDPGQGSHDQHHLPIPLTRLIQGLPASANQTNPQSGNLSGTMTPRPSTCSRINGSIQSAASVHLPGLRYDPSPDAAIDEDQEHERGDRSRAGPVAVRALIGVNPRLPLSRAAAGLGGEEEGAGDADQAVAGVLAAGRRRSPRSGRA